MKTLSSYIQEELDADNLQWKVDNWKRQCNPEQLSAFNSFCKASKHVNDPNAFKELINKYDVDFKSLVDTCEDNIDGDDNINYIYSMQKIIQNIK